MHNKIVRMTGRALSFSLAWCLAIIVCALPFSAAHAGTPKSVNEKFHEEAVGKISGGAEVHELVASSNGHVAWSEEVGQSIVRRDGVQQARKFDGVKYLEFSPDGNHLAFFGQIESNWLLVIDGQMRSEAYSEVTPVVFRSDGASWAFVGCATENTCQLVVDGAPTGNTYEQISVPQYSSDDKRLAYWGERNGKCAAFVNGQQIGPQMEACSWLGFSPDSKHFVLCGKSKKLGWTYFIDGMPGPYFAQLSPIVFSKDGAHYAYGGSSMQIGFKTNATSGTIVLDGKSGTLFHGNGSPGEWTLLVDASMMAGEAYEARFIAPILFLPGHLLPGSRILSPKLNGISDPAFDREDNPAYAARLGKNDVVVIDGVQSALHFNDVVSDIAFSDDGMHSAYVARRDYSFAEIVDNQLGKAILVDPKAASAAAAAAKPAALDSYGNPGTVKNPPSFDSNAFSVGWTVLTPHAEHFAYEIIHGRANFKLGRTQRAERTVVLDGEPQKKYNALGISPVQFTGDGRRYWYTVFGTDGKRSVVVVDGQESKLYDNIAEAQYDSADNQIVFFGREKKNIVRITVPLN